MNNIVKQKEEIMYKFKGNKRDVSLSCCPMGFYRGNDVVECYWFGNVTLNDCQICTVRKDKQKIKK